MCCCSSQVPNSKRSGLSWVVESKMTLPQTMTRQSGESRRLAPQPRLVCRPVGWWSLRLRDECPERRK
jgi:hypothetical protein